MKRIGLKGILMIGAVLFLGLGTIFGELIQVKFTGPGQVSQKQLGPLGTATLAPSGTIQGVANGTISFNATLLADSGDSLTNSALALWGRSIPGTWSATAGTFTGTGQNVVYHIPPADEGTYTIVYSATEGSRTFGSPPVYSVATKTAEATATLVVSTPRVTTVTIVPGTASLIVTGTQALTADIRSQMGNPMLDKVGTWSCLPVAGSFDPIVGSRTDFIAGTVAGTYEVTFTVTSVGTKTIVATATVTLLPTALAQIAISPSSATVNIEATQTFTAIGYDIYGNARTTGTCSFSLTGDVIGTIFPTSGTYTTYTGTAGGTAILWAISNGIQGSATMTGVVPPPYWGIIPTPQTAGTGFPVSLRIAGYNGVATLTATTGSIYPSTVTVVSGKWSGYATLTVTGSQTLIAISSTGAVAISNEFMVNPGPPKGLRAEGLPSVVIVGRPWQGTTTIIIIDICGNETKLLTAGALFFSLFPSYDGGQTWGAALGSLGENIVHHMNNKHPLAAGTSRVSFTGSNFVSKVSNIHLGDEAGKVCALGAFLDLP
ncbi:hypothetical protein COY61_01545 [bacterium (Candidatus Gribaldobacteria) CG_4_10_14_0_8_um_filter_33_9]|uniref:Uncharacterized protein n=1 Tax=bacterium (Candidatus Gribaldobacteria) CG_4_10_14_0_8_um_filter_33_9 TaxID=2014266 RepID=A0A2M7RMV0_9BACT|nr:MAG: hypothetical protein COY61_01545 [bacterium (Candidatus Gribaldobacteria) CG_4_10_14_0_8_um_filter_33_9]